MRRSKVTKSRLPVIHIIGLPGAGKTTLGEKLSKEFNLPVFNIGKYRSMFPSSEVGEADAWLLLFNNLSKQKWENYILETTGLNSRECFLRAAFSFPDVLTIKLVAQRKILYERIRMKNKSEQGGDWLFSADFRDKFEFARKMFGQFKNIPTEITIDTSRKTAQDVFRKAASGLKLWAP
jgi:cytidylate kinase